MKALLAKLAAGLVLLAAGAAALVASGIVPIKASSEHWPITAWLLHTAMRRSVATHSLGIEAPPLGDRALVLKGAGHYESGCRPCHGAPGTGLPVVPHQMTPHPPELAPRIPEWDAEGLFYVVKHGVKFTGMPAWPAIEREDEVWAMVAFLRLLPDLDADAYRALVHGGHEHGAPAHEGHEREGAGGEAGAAGLQLAAESCARCHGERGDGRGEGAFPRLAGQRQAYLLLSLEAYASGERWSGVMQPIAAALSAEEMRDLARHYAGLPPGVGLAVEPDADLLRRGEAIAHEGVPDDEVPSCADCHGPSPTRRNEAYPLLANQYERYLALQLELFRHGRRGGSEWWRLMHSFAPKLDEADIRAVAHYYATLPLEESVAPAR